MSDDKDDIGEYSGTSVEEISFVSIEVTCEFVSAEAMFIYMFIIEVYPLILIIISPVCWTLLIFPSTAFSSLRL